MLYTSSRHSESKSFQTELFTQVEIEKHDHKRHFNYLSHDSFLQKISCTFNNREAQFTSKSTPMKSINNQELHYELQ